MKISKRFASVVLIMILFVNEKATHAFTFADDAHDMLVDNQSENQNADATSRWSNNDSLDGQISERKKPRIEMARPMEPIADSSFPKEVSRGIASVGEPVVSSRSPAGSAVNVQKKKSLKTTDLHLPPPSRAVVRAVAKKKAYQEVSLIATELGFFPATVFVTQGIPVRLFVTAASSKAQCFMMDDFGVRRQIRSNKIEEVTFTPDQSGSFAYTCPMNGARGTIMVRELDLGLGRLPASVSNTASVDAVNHEEVRIEENSRNVSAHANPEFKSEIKDEDFGPEFSK